MRVGAVVESESRAPLALPKPRIRRVRPRLRTVELKMPQLRSLDLRPQDRMAAETARRLPAGDRQTACIMC